jgi:hypothetical protein
MALLPARSAPDRFYSGSRHPGSGRLSGGVVSAEEAGDEVGLTLLELGVDLLVSVGWEWPSATAERQNPPWSSTAMACSR